MTDTPLAVMAAKVAPRPKSSAYPPPYDARVAGREKRALGDVFGLTSFGVNLTRLAPGTETALLHIHATAQEFVYVLEGTPTLVTDQGEVEMAPGMCTGFPAMGIAHHIVNRTDQDVVILEIGDRREDDAGIYPDDDLMAERHEGRWRFLHKDGTPY